MIGLIRAASRFPTGAGWISSSWPIEFYEFKAARIFSTHESLCFARSCSQIRMMRQPSLCNSRFTRRSRALFTANFFFQNTRLLAGILQCFGQPCQKQPSTNSTIIGSITTSAAITVGGLALIVLPTVIVGNELLIMGGVAAAVGLWFLAHRHGQLRGQVDAGAGNANNSEKKGEV